MLQVKPGTCRQLHFLNETNLGLKYYRKQVELKKTLFKILFIHLKFQLLTSLFLVQ